MEKVSLYIFLLHKYYIKYHRKSSERAETLTDFSRGCEKIMTPVCQVTQLHRKNYILANFANRNFKIIIICVHMLRQQCSLPKNWWGFLATKTSCNLSSKSSLKCHHCSEGPKQIIFSGTTYSFEKILN